MSPPGAARAHAIAGFLLAGAAVLVLGFLVGRAGPADRATLPPIEILAPADGDVVTNPVTLRFTTPAPLRLDRDGWSAGDLHLHLMLDRGELMPAAADIVADDSAFAWRLPPLPAGPHHLYLTWAGRHHGNLAGPTDTVALHVGR